jgi:Glycosyl transferase family 90
MILSSRGTRRRTRFSGEVRRPVEAALHRVSLLHTNDTGEPLLISYHPSILMRLASRFLRMSSDQSDANRTVVFADPPGTDSFTYAKVPIKQLNNDFMDTAFTKAVGCIQYNPGGCDGLRRDHRFADAVPLGEHWRHKYLIDLDGMGYSARLFAFLASDSAVIKSTVYREFFSEWVQPWFVS